VPCYSLSARKESPLLGPLFEQYQAQIPNCRPEEIAAYEKHFSLLLAWNQKMNLVSRKSIDKAFGAHYVDSLFIADFARRFYEEKEVVDVGTGAGFPGFIFAIRFPDILIEAFEKSLKKQTFLSAVQASLPLPNLRVFERLEDQPRAGLFLARAVFPPEELFRYMRRHMGQGSILIANFGGQTEPVKAPARFTLLDQARYALPQDCGQRRVEAYRYG